MSPGHIAIRWQILVQEREQLEAPGSIPPIAHQVHHDSKHALEYNPGILHAAIGVICKLLTECAAGLGVGEDGVAF